jgi:hypothetical protein
VDADAGLGTDTDIAADADSTVDGDETTESDADVAADAEPDVEVPGLCDGADSAWPWPACSDDPNPPDCCSACQKLTCRELATTQRIWEDFVVLNDRSEIAMVDLRTGEDRLVLEREHDGGNVNDYFEPAISSRYIVAGRYSGSFPYHGEGISEAIVARRLDDLSGPVIIVEDSYPEDSYTYIQVYDQWAIWQRSTPHYRQAMLVLHNIETGEQRILDGFGSDSLPGHHFRAPGIWGDRVAWGRIDSVNGETLMEHRISTSTTRAVLSDRALLPMYTVSVWEHYAVFNHQPSGGDWNVMLVDLDTGEVRQISPSGSRQDQGYIQGGRVIWTDFRGAEDEYPAGMHIYIYSLRTGREYVLNPSARGGSEPLIFGQTVIWNGEWNGFGGPWVTRIGDI